ncbi:hypothetical protein BGZ83_010435 [Gryganskiella cystojenkinii]|nr:hypothetical protein BGZ83_010435 [Gryganskiella cystojenkinii]
MSEAKTRKPANTAFKQQRLKAWQPILTPKTVVPTFILVGILFPSIGGLLLWASDSVAEIVIDYTKCNKATPNFTPIPQDSYSVNFPSYSGNVVPPEFMAVTVVGSANNITWPMTKCTIKFNVPVKLRHPVFVYYRLSNFYQNHRRYVKSLDAKQLSGVARTATDLKGGGCDPLAVVTENGVSYPIYPCGLIANSIFNDTLGLVLNNTENPNKPYLLTDTGIAWKSDARKYGVQTYPDLTKVRPPPNWLKYSQGYSAAVPPKDITTDEHFQVWMRTAGLPNFRKLYSKNEQEDLQNGTYTIDIEMNYNVSSYGGTKSLVISTVSFMGGRNPFLGVAYVVVGVLCVVLGLLFIARHLYKPRRLGDHTYLSWNQNSGAGANAPSTATATGASARY